MAPQTQPKVKLGVVGCGVVATAYYLPYIMRMANAELTAVCDLVKARTDAHVCGSLAQKQRIRIMTQ
ncbi:MAG: hypothetical protein R2867_41770 [Caldilineaceae bacterium]